MRERSRSPRKRAISASTKPAVGADVEHPAEPVGFAFRLGEEAVGGVEVPGAQGGLRDADEREGRLDVSADLVREAQALLVLDAGGVVLAPGEGELAAGAGDLGAGPAVADAVGDLVELGEVGLDRGEAAGEVDGDVGAEHEGDAEFPVPGVAAAVLDGFVEVEVEVAGIAGEEPGHGPEHAGEAGGLGTAVAEGLPDPGGEFDVLGGAELLHRAAFCEEEDVEDPEAHQAPVRG